MTSTAASSRPRPTTSSWWPAARTSRTTRSRRATRAPPTACCGSAALTGEHEYGARAESVLRLLHELAPRHPQAFGHLLQALDFRLAQVKEVALVGAELRPLERVVRGSFRPHLVIAGGEPDGVPLLEGREPVEGRPTAYVCEQFACRAPVTEPAELESLLA